MYNGLHFTGFALVNMFSGTSLVVTLLLCHQGILGKVYTLVYLYDNFGNSVIM